MLVITLNDLAENLEMYIKKAAAGAEVTLLVSVEECGIIGENESAASVAIAGSNNSVPAAQLELLRGEQI